MINTKTTSLVCLFLCSSILLFAQPGTLDNTFDTDGKVTTDVVVSDNDVGQAIVVQPDGKIIVAGFSDDGSIGFYYAVVRYNSDGTLDNTFSGDGMTSADFAASSWARSVALQQDGKILVGGGTFTTNNTDFALVRYNADGSQDSTFGTGGRVATDIGGIFGSDQAYSIILQQDGKIVLTGDSYNGLDLDFALTRYNTDGSLDNTFSSDGKVTASFVRSEDYGWSSALQVDGKILVAGASSFETTGQDFALLRFNTDGSLDNSFDTDGMLVTDLGNSIEEGRSVTVQPDGKILVTGWTFDGADGNIALVRYNPDGSLDNSFDSDGKLITVLTDGGIGYSVVLQSDGKILVAGTTGADFALLRYNSDGSLDNSFSTDGITTTNFGAGIAVGYAATIQPDGKIVVAGELNGPNLFAVARYISGLVLGEVEFSMSGTNIYIYPNPIRSEAILEYTLSEDEMISLELYDMSGKLTENFINAEMRRKGTHRETIKFKDSNATGNYVLVLENGSGCLGIKVVLE